MYNITMPDNIHDFVANWKKWDKIPGLYLAEKQSTSTPLSSSWSRRFEEASYYKVSINYIEFSEWENIRTWCKEHIGERYTWVGPTINTNPKLEFWFERSEDAMLFTLNWL